MEPWEALLNTVMNLWVSRVAVTLPVSLFHILSSCISGCVRELEPRGKYQQVITDNLYN
jgi:hypothetical protein